MESIMNVVYSSSDLFSEIAAVSIYSLLMNNKRKQIHIYVIDNGIKPVNKDKLIQLVHSFNQTIDFFPIPDIEGMVGRKINVGRWNISTFGRCFLTSILPETVDKLMFIDADTIVRHSLEDLYDSDMNGMALLGVDDCRGGKYRENIDLPYDHNYINCGFMLVDLALWRKIDIEKQYIKFINDKNGDITYMDQGVINGVLGQKDLVGLIHPRYNCQRLFFDFPYEELIKLRKPSFHYAKNEYEEAVKDPTVVHFTTCFISGTRPWNEIDRHPFKKEFLEYKKKTPWGDILYWPDDRKKGKKFMSFVCQRLPRKAMISFISFVHTKVYPLVRNIKMS